MPATIHELKVTLRNSKPPIWRKVAVPSGVTLGQLHVVIQIVMGWHNSHLHHFIQRSKSLKVKPAELVRIIQEQGWAAVGAGLGRGERYFVGRSPYGEDLDMEGEDEESVTLGEVCPQPKSKIIYEYDFGDSWEHDVVVQKVYEPKEGVVYPVCLGGKGAGPPEDCGGIWGYHHLLEVLGDPTHEEHEDMMEWTGGPIDPDAFDLDEVNRALGQLRPKKKKKSTGKRGARKVWVRTDPR